VADINTVETWIAKLVATYFLDPNEDRLTALLAILRSNRTQLYGASVTVKFDLSEVAANEFIFQEEWKQERRNEAQINALNRQVIIYEEEIKNLKTQALKAEEIPPPKITPDVECSIITCKAVSRSLLAVSQEVAAELVKSLDHIVASDALYGYEEFLSGDMSLLDFTSPPLESQRGKRLSLAKYKDIHALLSRYFRRYEIVSLFSNIPVAEITASRDRKIGRVNMSTFLQYLSSQWSSGCKGHLPDWMAFAIRCGIIQRNLRRLYSRDE
jgi:hypothetical protein